MPLRGTQFYSGAFYHLYNRGANSQDVFYERENYRFFLRQMRKYFRTEEADIVAHCLMPNHYHLLIRLTTDDLRMMQPFLLSYTKAMNKRYDRNGSLFQGRFKAVIVDREPYLLQLSRYIHLNPCKAGLVDRPQDWEFSSYLEYVGTRKSDLVKPEIVLTHFASRAEYQAFVESPADTDECARHLFLEQG